jgi:hypothetical protein
MTDAQNPRPGAIRVVNYISDTPETESGQVFAMRHRLEQYLPNGSGEVEWAWQIVPVYTDFGDGELVEIPQ